jgi:putative transposase
VIAVVWVVDEVDGDDSRPVSHAQLIFHELGEYLGYSPPPLLERLIEDAQKIHQQRPILQETLATATQPRCEA